MCGIAGILAHSSVTRGIDLVRAIRSMTDAQKHRGPDDTGVNSVPLHAPWELHLGHRRLSILDVSKHGHQPMEDRETGSWICYNGEIYNHLELRETLAKKSFSSTSDTETLLHGWLEFGPEFVNRLRGIFAFAIYDGRRHQLWLIRDRLGVKPLYWSRDGQSTLLFASEVRAILASGMVSRHLSQAGLFSYLSFGAVQAPETMVADIRAVLPGERILIDCNHLGDQLNWKSDRYWHPAFVQDDEPTRSPGVLRDARETIVSLKAVFDDAVRSRFLSDVPIGVFLSGGVDSSAIVASAARQQLQPATFSIAFDEAEFDESTHARAVAEACGVELTVLPVTAASMLADLEEALDRYDQPSSDGLNTYTISKAARAVGLKVAISGLGGDEGFAGYSSFRRLAAAERWQRRLRLLRGTAGNSLVACLAEHHRRLARGAEMLLASPSRVGIYSCLRRFYSPTEIRRLTGSIPRTSQSIADGVAKELEQQAGPLDAVNAISLLELSLYMPNMLLRDTDQMSMAHGLEVRTPLLDHLLIDRLATIRGKAKLAGEGMPNKWLLVELVRDSLPAAVFERRKMGFVFPWDRWLRNELRGFVDRHLLDRDSVESVGLEADEVARVWQQYQAGRGGFRYADLLALLNLIRWCRVNEVSVAPSGEAI